MSTRVLSWMAVAVGDPLYRPYFSWMQLEANRDSKTAADWRTYHDFAVKNGHLPPMEYRLQARIAALRAHDALELEDVGLMELRDGNYANAIGCLQQARNTESKRWLANNTSLGRLDKFNDLRDLVARRDIGLDCFQRLTRIELGTVN